MKSIDINHQLKGLTRLNTLNLERKLSSAKQFDLINNSIFIDLSQCRFAELNALTKLLLIIECYLKDRHDIYLALPTNHYTAGENRTANVTDTLKEGILKARQNANNFLKRSGFVSAVQDIASKYETSILITEEYDFEKEGFNEDSFRESFSVEFEQYLLDEKGYKFLLPFKWINCEDNLDRISDFADLEERIDRILTNKDRGLDSLDVKGIRNVILSELIKNVKEHSNSKYAIFTIGLISSESLFRTEDYNNDDSVEYEYLHWLSESNISSQVELYFGDSGRGLLNKEFENYVKSSKAKSSVTKKEQIEFAFSKWSTLKDNNLRRGTKGLYRLLRIVNKYNGLIHIDTLKSDGGFSRNRPVFRTTGYNFQGTLINIKLNPYKEIQLVNYSVDDNIKEKKWTSRRYKLDNSCSCLNAIKSDIKNSENLLVILDTNNLNFALEESQKSLENVLYEISFDAHPTSVVIYLITNGGNITTGTIVDSVQVRIIENLGDHILPEIKNEDHEEIHDPVLVLGDSNEAFWYGGSKELINILQESYNSGIQIHDLAAFKKITVEKQGQILLHLKGFNSDLLRLDANNRIVFNFRNIERHYEETIINALTESQMEVRCSPKVHITDRWIDVKTMLKRDEFGFALCLYILYRAELERQNISIASLDKESIFILIDHSLHSELAKRFAELLGLKVKNIRNIDSDIDNTIPKRTKLFPKNAKVIFLTTMISSSETIRRLVKFARRDYANPEIILCLGNFRKYNINELETWSETTKILSCYQANQTEASKEIRNKEYFDRKHQQLNAIGLFINPDLSTEKADEKNENLIQVNPLLMEFLKKNKLLHYNHFGFYNKRHFTFFLDKIKILNTESFLWNKIADTFNQWLKEKKLKNYRIYVNASILGESNFFLDKLKSISNGQVTILGTEVKFINDSNVIYFDFGILTGESVNEFLAKCISVENLLVCVLFDQSVNSNKDLYKRINTIKYQTLTGDYKATNFSIEYLYHLPLSFYTSENCPICEHRRALDYFQMEHDYLFKFSEDRQERLKQNSVDDIHEIDYPVDFYYSTAAQDQELSSNLILQMYNFRILLENAKTYTRSRIEIFGKLYVLWTNIDDELTNAESEIYAIIYYLSHEINWFQQEPLIFRDFRILISEIALRLTTEPIDNLIAYFEHSNHYNIKPLALASRYKYSAISILRSTDKLTFCQNIKKIIQSSFYEGHCVDNLLQNVLYHISSFYKNSYNKSERYYIEISSNLLGVLSETTLSEEQISAIRVLITENNKVRRGIVSVSEEPTNFKEMKDKWIKIYKVEMPKHPAPFVELKELTLSRYDVFFREWDKRESFQDVEETISSRIMHINNNWINLKGYIESNIVHYFRNYLHKLNESAYFRERYDHSFNVKYYERQESNFGELVKKIENDLNYYFDHRKEYEELLKYFQETFVETTNISDFKNDSKILELLSDFPSDVTSLIDEVFQSGTYMNKQLLLRNGNELLKTSYEHYNAYFPSSKLKMFLSLIRDNLDKRLNKDSSLADVNLRFVVCVDEINVLQLEIIYDCTDQCQDTPNPRGSLAAFNDTLLEFGGSLTYTPPDKDVKDFSIHIKFLRYE